MDNVIEFRKDKSLEELITEKLGDKFLLGYMDGTNCITYINSGMSDIEMCYIIDTLSERRKAINHE